MLTLMILTTVISSATFAWYIYNTGAHTTDVQLAAGSGGSLEIAKSYGGPYSSNTDMGSYAGPLVPVSTDKMLNGFQHVTEFVSKPSGLVASLFGAASLAEYYKTSLFIKGQPGQSLYIYNIGYQDASASAPVSTAMRVGFVVYETTASGDFINPKEYIFAINTSVNSTESAYNTAQGSAGHVLDSLKSDGSTVAFTPYTPDNYCGYDTATEEVSKKQELLPSAMWGQYP